MNDNNSDDMGLEKLKTNDAYGYQELIGLIHAFQNNLHEKHERNISDYDELFNGIMKNMNEIGEFIIQHHYIMKPILTVKGISSIQTTAYKVFTPDSVFDTDDLQSLLNHDMYSYNIITEICFYFILTQNAGNENEIRRKLYVFIMESKRDNNEDLLAFNEKYQLLLASTAMRMNDDLLNGYTYEYVCENYTYEINANIEDLLSEFNSMA